MTTDNANELFPAQSALFGELEKNWGWLLAFGLASIVLGTIGLGMTYYLTQATAVFIGALLIVGGVLQLLDAMKCRGWKSVAWHILIALLYVVAGLITVTHHQIAAISLTLILASILIAVGILRAIIAFQIRPAKGWYWPLISGIVSLILGGMIMAEWPQSGLWIIGLFIAIELIFNGWSYVFVALAARTSAKQRKREQTA
ncbi:MAG: HdeD family acid-resistance protein [Thiohalocapsa sp.]|nr:HdeD family acid-resistance protein [Thiohalocapsa sp.]MCF7992268.1 HdeD family acid-resistance protein [Thiohalocapsa sp.]